MDYKNGKIYTIRSYQTDQLYIGSTTQPLSKRLYKHVSDYKRYLKGEKNFITSFEIIKFDDAYIELLEEYPCENKMMLQKREGELIRINTCVNKVIPCRTLNEWKEENKDKIKEQQKEYREQNKDINKEYNKEYRKQNEDKIKEQQKEYYEQNKEYCKDKQKEYYEQNKYKIKEKAKEYYEQNKEKIKEQKRIYYEQNKKNNINLLYNE
jgi:hypothetical protein